MIISSGLGLGGAEVLLDQILEGIGQEIFNIKVISLTDMGEVGQRIKNKGFDVSVCNMHKVFNQPFALMQLICTIRDFSPDIVQCWMYHANFLGAVAARLAGVRKVVWGIHGLNLERGAVSARTHVISRMGALSSRFLPKKIIACARSAASEHIKIGYDQSRMVVIENGIDTERFKPDLGAGLATRRNWEVPDNVSVVGMMARFDPVKNHRGFIKMAETICRSIHPNPIFVLAGPDVDIQNAEIKRWISETGLESRFRVIGTVRNQNDFYPALDIHVSPSWNESFSLVTLEALACGVPSVVTNVGDCARVLGPGGIVVPVGDNYALGNAVKELLQMDTTIKVELCKKGRLHVVENFSIQRVRQEYINLYQELR